jgi:threonine/homoserine/homoserine lactone efflux protein
LPGTLLGDVIGDLLPSAFAVALSPIPIVAVVLVLGSPRARASGTAFALGWVGGLSVASVVVVLVASAGHDPDTDDPGLSWLKIAIGVLFLLVMAARQWRKRPREGQEAEMPGWMATVDSATPRRALALGAALSAANPKNLALTLAAAASIAEAGILLAPERAARPLEAVRRFMAANNAVIMMIVLLLLGAKLLGDGLTVL